MNSYVSFLSLFCFRPFFIYAPFFTYNIISKKAETGANKQKEDKLEGWEGVINLIYKVYYCSLK